MTSLLGQVIGNKGHRASRQGSRASGMIVTMQSITERINMTAVWDKDAHKWTVVITKDLIRITDGRELIEMTTLWTGSLME